MTQKNPAHDDEAAHLERERHALFDGRKKPEDLLRHFTIGSTCWNQLYNLRIQTANE